jgi:hypothetical protein
LLGFFLPGVNQVTGQVTAIGPGGSNFTNDVFAFEIPAGAQLNSITLTSFSTSSGGGMFMMLDDSAVFEFQPEEINDDFFLPDLSLILGGTVVGGADVGTDVLDNLQLAASFGNGSFFTTPLGPGSYSVYLQETAAFSNYSLAFNVTTIPEPSAWIAVAAITSAAVLIRRRKHTKKTV